MLVTDADKFANTNDIYICLAGKYYRRVVGLGFRIATPEEVAAVKSWAPLRQVQLDAFLPLLREQGLVS